MRFGALMGMVWLWGLEKCLVLARGLDSVRETASPSIQSPSTIRTRDENETDGFSVVQVVGVGVGIGVPLLLAIAILAFLLFREKRSAQEFREQAEKDLLSLTSTHQTEVSRQETIAKRIRESLPSPPTPEHNPPTMVEEDTIAPMELDSRYRVPFKVSVSSSVMAVSRPELSTSISHQYVPKQSIGSNEPVSPTESLSFYPMGPTATRTSRNTQPHNSITAVSSRESQTRKPSSAISPRDIQSFSYTGTISPQSQTWVPTGQNHPDERIPAPSARRSRETSSSSRSPKGIRSSRDAYPSIYSAPGPSRGPASSRYPNASHSSSDFSRTSATTAPSRETLASSRHPTGSRSSSDQNTKASTTGGHSRETLHSSRSPTRPREPTRMHSGGMTSRQYSDTSIEETPPAIMDVSPVQPATREERTTQIANGTYQPWGEIQPRWI